MSLQILELPRWRCRNCRCAGALPDPWWTGVSAPRPSPGGAPFRPRAEIVTDSNTQVGAASAPGGARRCRRLIRYRAFQTHRAPTSGAEYLRAHAGGIGTWGGYGAISTRWHPILCRADCSTRETTRSARDNRHHRGERAARRAMVGPPSGVRPGADGRREEVQVPRWFATWHLVELLRRTSPSTTSAPICGHCRPTPPSCIRCCSTCA